MRLGIGKKVQRVRFLTGWADAALDMHGNVGDVCELGESLALALVASGVAESTDLPVGRAASLTPDKSCWRCGGIQEFLTPRCPYCGAPS